MAVKMIKAIYTPTVLAGAYAAPVKVLPAPPAGFVNNILGVSHDMTYNSAAYTTASKIIYGASDGINVFEDDNVLGATGDYNLPGIKKVATQLPFSTTKDFYMTTDAAAATGNSTIEAYIIYEQVQL